MNWVPLLLGAVVGCVPDTEVSRRDAGAPPWAPEVLTVPPTKAPDTGSDPDTTEPVPTGCIDMPEVHAENAASTFDEAAAWLPAGPDFDFDADGYVVTMVGPTLVRFDQYGAGEIVLDGVGAAWGVRSLPTAELVVTRPELGMTAIVTRDGQARPFLGGMRYPTALEVGLDGNVYVADEVDTGEVWMADPYTAVVAHLLDVPFPSALALSPDDRTLFVASSMDRYYGPGRVVALDRDEDGAWDPTTLRQVHQTEWPIRAMTTDVCGNLYVGEVESSRVSRVWPDGTVEGLGSLVDDAGNQVYGLSALRFGAGAGGFVQDTLYASAGGVLYALSVGVEGRHVLSAN